MRTYFYFFSISNFFLKLKLFPISKYFFSETISYIDFFSISKLKTKLISTIKSKCYIYVIFIIKGANMNLFQISHSLSVIKDIYMGFSKNAIFRYARVVEATSGEENRFALSTKESCDDSEAKDLFNRLSDLELEVKKIKASLSAKYNIKDAKPRRKKIGCSSCGRKREQG